LESDVARAMRRIDDVVRVVDARAATRATAATRSMRARSASALRRGVPARAGRARE
jgi:hypothetical protein